MTAAQDRIVLTPHQQLAFDGVLDFCKHSHAGAAVLEGFAGCGKTTLVGKLVKALRQVPGFQIALAAPTHKAAKVLEEKVGIGEMEGATIHSLLGLRVKKNGDKSFLEPSGYSTMADYDVAIVDECSMISSTVMSHAFRSRGQCKILFVGDPAQLAPTDGDGEESPVFGAVQTKIRLSEVVRQAADNPIIAVTIAARQAIEEQRRVTIEEIARAVPKGAGQAAVMPGSVQALSEWAASEFLAGVDCRVVAYTNARVKAYNEAIHSLLYGPPGPDDCEFSPGERLIVQSEFQALSKERVHTSEELEFLSATRSGEKHGFPAWLAELRRSDGSIVKAHIAQSADDVEQYVKREWRRWRSLRGRANSHPDYDVRRQATLEAGDMARRINAIQKGLANLRHAYAITAHKCQGSTYHTVYVDWKNLSEMQSDADFCRGLYVAASRASDHLAIVTS